jgi:hypothetical protein
MGAHWGVDSVTPANRQVGGRYFFDIVADRCRTAPEFWGRYLNTYSYALTVAEKNFLLCRKCRILLVYNGPSRSPLVGAGSHAAGRNSATAAIALAQGLGISDSRVRLYADLEGWPTSAEWFRGWCEVMAASPYAGLGGIYGNASAHWSWPANATAGAQNAVDARFNALVSDIVAGRTSKTLDLHFWSTRPCLAQNHPLPPVNRIIPPTFRPSPPPPTGFRFTRTVLWQYRLNVTGITGGLVDLDLCNDQGLEGTFYFGQ